MSTPVDPPDGAADGEEVVYEFGDFSFTGPNLDIEPPPDELPYPQHEDHRSMALLSANGIAATPDGIVEALSTQSGVVLAAAAHASGELGLDGATPSLRTIVRGPDDVAAVEAGYALARLGHDDGASFLREAAARPLDASLAPVLAAGYLAQLGDARALPVVAQALGSEFLGTRMLAAKKLFFFAPYHPLSELFGPALRHDDTAIQGQALAELRLLRSAEARPLVEEYLERATDEDLCRLAESISAALGG